MPGVTCQTVEPDPSLAGELVNFRELSNLGVKLQFRHIHTSGCLKLCLMHGELDWIWSVNFNGNDVNLLLLTAP